MTLFTKGQAITFLEDAFGPGAISGDNLSVLCPFCKTKKGSSYAKKKLAIRTDNFVTHCWVCGYKSGNLIHLLKNFSPGHLKKYFEVFAEASFITSPCRDLTVQEKPTLALPDSFVMLPFAKDGFNKPFAMKAMAYLQTRGISAVDAIWYWKFGVSPNDSYYRDYLIIPSFDLAGNLNYFTGRLMVTDKNRPNYRNPVLPRESVVFNEININWKRPLVITEGPFDLLKTGENATCLLGSELSTEYKLFIQIVKNETPVVLALDPDAQKKTFRIAALFHEYGIEVKLVNIPSGYKDVGEMTQEEFKAVLSSATLYDRDVLFRHQLTTMMFK